VRNNILRGTTALAATVGILGFLAAAPAAGADGNGDVEVVNSETVQVYMTPDGDIDTKRVYEQLALTGKGKVDLTNPIATDGLRNLDGFEDFEVEDGEQLVQTDVDGEKKLRSVSDYNGGLPLDIDVDYELDGRTVKPGDLVGESGKLEVTFNVENVTGKMQEVEVPDGKGGTISKTVEVPIPMVGSLTSVAPENFTNVASEQANLAGDGKGGTKLSFTMTLFPPVGSNSATFGYTADVRDGVVPRIDVSALPINPLESPTFASAAESYQGGADTGAKLTDGAVEIDANLLRLRDGAAELLAGLIKLRDGSSELSEGLNDTAVPGSAKLAAGAEELSLGLLKLDDGAGQLADGAGELSDGTAKASDGSQKLSDGASELSGGVDTLDSKVPDLAAGSDQLLAGQKGLANGLKQLYAGVNGLPVTVKEGLATNPNYQALLGALGQVITGIGTLSDQPQADPTKNTLLGGLNALKYGLRYPAGPDCAGAPLTKCGVLDGVAAVQKGIDDQVDGSAGLGGALTAARSSAGCAGDPVCANNLDAIIPTLTDLPTNLDRASKALGTAIAAGDNQMIPGINLIRSKVSTGANPASCPTNPAGCGAREALLAVQGGIPQLVDGIAAEISRTLLSSIGTPTPGCNPQATLRCASAALVNGQGELNDGVKQLVEGVSQLQAGGVQLSGGAADLASGLGQIDDGAGKLSDGAGQLADGTAKASDGGSQVADGAGQLADGLKDAGDGSTKLFEGLVTAANGAPKLEDGAQRLSDEGTKKLIAAGESTTSSYGEMVSVIKAGAERGSAEKMAYGAPDDAVGLTAYSYIIKGADGESGRNMARALGGLAVFGAAGGMFLLRRRGVI